MRRLYRATERYEHEVKFGVVGVDRPAAVVVEHDLLSDPEIAERNGRGGLDLPDNLFDDLAIKCFELMGEQIYTEGGDSGWWSIPDITKWITNQFPAAEAQHLLAELSRHVTPSLEVRGACLVADDDAI